MELERPTLAQPPPTPGRLFWLRSFSFVTLPAMIAAGGFSAMLRVSMSRSTELLVMAWSILMTAVASRAVTLAFRAAAARRAASQQAPLEE